MMKLSLTKNVGILLLALLAFSACRNPENEILPTCFDEIQNQGEIRVDCGGPNCPECQPSCDDKIANQDEQSSVANSFVIGIDCGGENCEPCSSCEDGVQNAHWVRDPNLTQADIGKADVAQSKTGMLYRLVMESGIDCGFPCPQVCVSPATDDDGIMNGDEEGIDCGGSTGNPCPPPTCNDGIQNGTETGIDCGDMAEPSNCGPCPDPTCDDGIQNTHIEINENTPAGYIVVIETGIDCDNQGMTACPDCPLPTCFDGIQNGGETGIDCGGNCGTLCDPEPNCNNGIMDGNETGIDCDNDPLTPCPTCPTCDDGIKNGPEFDVDCLDYPIPGFEQCDICPSCHDGIQNPAEDLIFELDVDCGGPNCKPCLQYVVADLIGTASPTAFVDQYRYNRMQAQAGNTDTLELDHNLYPGLKAEKFANFGLGDPYLKITANQGFMTASNGLYIRTVVLYMRFPENLEGNTDDHPDLGAPSFGLCEPVPIVKLPFIVYKEKLVESPNLLNNCLTSYEAQINPPLPLTETITLTIDYLYGLPQASEYYAKGNFDAGSLHAKKLDGTMQEGGFENVQFAIQYPFYP